MNFIHEEYGLLLQSFQCAFGLLAHGFQILHSAHHRIELREVRRRPLRNDPRERRLPGSGRTRQDHGTQHVLFDCSPECCPLRNSMLLSYKIRKCLGADAVGERLGGDDRENSGHEIGMIEEVKVMKVLKVMKVGHLQYVLYVQYFHYFSYVQEEKMALDSIFLSAIV